MIICKHIWQKYLKMFDDGSNLAALSGSELLERFESELNAVELVHNFGFEHPKSCGIDVSIASCPRSPDFYNQWVIQAAGIYPVDPGTCDLRSMASVVFVFSVENEKECAILTLSFV